MIITLVLHYIVLYSSSPEVTLFRIVVRYQQYELLFLCNLYV